MMREAFFPATLGEALAARAEEPLRPVAGGTDLMVQFRPHAPVPVELNAPPLFISQLDELHTVARDEKGWAVGATVTLRELAGSGASSAGLREVLKWFASPAIRNAATIGGNVCNASPAGDLLPWLIAHDARVVLQSANANRTMLVSDFITGPGATVMDETELLTRLEVPAGTTGDSIGASRDLDFWYYRKVAPRRSNALSKLSVYAEAKRTDSGKLTDFRLAIGAVAPKVVRLREAEEMMAGLSAGSLRGKTRELLSLYGEAIVPIDDQRSTAIYRRHTALALIKHIVEERLPSFLEQT